ncbi:RagB/SusD family nutrient uptake outer membrane protein [Plebeiibacterium sediminum]|uniref:RagB/SusD family nutrient uptake outer membrane protein n=1 Tax=Plebeiibacterium sediminum TaxID=2992112 RepID=A0AAE3M838_9BACT|nr:RagB/SusD family nutrient uptake outer membrane protein [Plebeiobacterium sediminum]MCW3788996.1 RagB/SusD family nutrient uptake outer membrane protein [Plebeiobacterium sediminum]
MRNIYKTLLCSAVLFLVIGLYSCEDYLDRDPESIVSEEVAFRNFKNFQGFIEEMYNCIPNKENYYWVPSYNWGEGEIFNINSDASNMLGYQFDLGNFWSWQNSAHSWLDADRSDPTSGDRFNHRLWTDAWYCIRKANLGLENMDLLTQATDEERDLIRGQLYFFRAWFHFEMIQWFGGLPYIDRALSASETLRMPRLTFQECADKAAADFEMAASLLPIDWDNTSVGANNTGGHNEFRINKIMALGYLGKTYLWAGSPLMKNGAQTGGANAHNYDVTYCAKAADALGQLLELVESGQTQYELAKFEFTDIYNHESDAEDFYTEIFYTKGQSFRMPGAKEAIFRGPANTQDGSGWQFLKTWGPKVNDLIPDDKIIHQPTANYVNYYGMANGLPLDDPNSGFDPSHPFQNRDPRFYHDIIVDGFKYVNGSMSSEDEVLRYCSLYSDGMMRDKTLGSRTGYFMQKFAPHTCNKYDQDYSWGAGIQVYIPYIRLADVYLMYAEACGAVGGATASSSTYELTAEQAINTLRDRCGAGHVDASYTADNIRFIDEVRRERAVELAGEGFRFNDLQRWLLLTEYPYNIKTAQEFDRVEASDWYAENDCKDAEVRNFREEIILTREFGVKHYWLPLKISDVSIYPEFNQNPGW